MPSGAPERARRWSGRWPAGVLVVAGLLVSAAALRPDGGLLGTAATGPAGAAGLVVLLGAGWAVVVGRFAMRFREEVRHLDGPTPWAERLRQGASVLLPGAAVAVPVLMYLFRLRASGADDPPAVPLEPLPTLSTRPTPPPSMAVDEGSGSLFGLVFAGLIAVLAVAAVIALLVVLVSGLRRLRLHREGPASSLPAAPPRPEDVLAAAVATGRRALSGDDARAAVIACYAAMEGSLAASGVSRRVCDSPAELLERAVADDRVDRFHAKALTELFREARYSTHPMDDAHVRRAQTALDAISAHLESRAEEPPAPVAAAGRTGDRR